MRNRVERLRVWLLVGAGLLVVVLGVFIGSARYLRRHLLAMLPARLGVNIKSESDGPVSYSHSVGHTTVYTINASRQTEYTDGKIVLHDVDMTLYGQKGDRSDRISGKEFEYDKNSGVVRAIGLVHIDLQAASAGGAGLDRATGGKTPAPAQEDGAGDAKIVHATTSGLVYMDKLAVAATNERVDFRVGQMTGHAIGADYNSDSNVLMLHSAVYASGIAGGRPVVLTASSAELDNRNQLTFLEHAKYISLGETVEGEQATLHTRPDGTLARIEAEGNVTSEAEGAKVVSARADLTLNAKSQPEAAVLTGGVLYTADGPLRQVRGLADAATIAFDTQAHPQHGVFTGSVHMTERTRASEAVKEPWSVRDLTAAKVETELAAAGNGRAQLRDAEATGSAHLTVVNNGTLKSAGGLGRTELSGDDLKAHLVGTGNAKQPPQLDTVAGRGHTVVHQWGADGIEQTSSGDMLDAKFRRAVALPAGTAKGGVGSDAGRQAGDWLLSAVQQGHVAMMRRVPAKPEAKAGAKAAGQANAQDDVEHAMGDRAVYDGDLDRMTLTGNVRLTDADDVLWANQVALDHKTGDAQAAGAVKVNYFEDRPQASPAAASPVPPGNVGHSGAAGGSAQQTGEAEPAHILADRADLKHATGIATFYGKPARLWQGGSQVQAPVLEFWRVERRLIARGDVGDERAAGKTGVVHTVLVSAGGDGPGSGKAGAGKPAADRVGADQAAAGKTGGCKADADKPGAGKPGAGARPPQVVRIASRELVYSDLLRQAEFTGGVRAESADGTMLAREATVYLQAAGAGGKSGAAAPGSSKSDGISGSAGGPGLSLSGRIERVVATGHIEVEQPGGRANGERLVYTASDGLYVLTGEGSALAKVVDAQGTTTGAAFQYHSGDCSVEALGGVPGGNPQRVRTDTRVSNDAKTGKGKN